MNKPNKLEDAEKMVSLLPVLMRRLFTLDDDLAVNLPLGQLRVCALLSKGPCQMTAISRELGVSLSAMTQIADRLGRTKLVSRVADKNDRRIRCLQLTPLGGKKMREREISQIQNVSAVLNTISDGARKEILASLEALLKASAVLKTGKASHGKLAAGLRQTYDEILISKVAS